MAEKFALMERQQTGALGTVVPGVAYLVGAKNKAVFEAYEAAGFCQFLSPAQLKKRGLAASAADAAEATAADSGAA